MSAAKYLSRGQIVEISGGGDLMTSLKDLDFLPGFALEGYPNRDSTLYADLYGISSDVSTILRGTLRYKGFAECVQCMQLLGLIDPNPHPMLHPDGPEVTWRQMICECLGLADSNIFYENLKTRIAERGGSTGAAALEILGLLDEAPVKKLGTPLDTLSYYLSKKLALGKDERDIVILRHSLGIMWPDSRRENRGINLVVYGEHGGHSAMAKTVGIPVAIATKMILDGEIQQRGVVLPFTPDIYRPMLSRLRAEGITETVTSTWIS